MEVTEQLTDSAMTLAERHALRGYDAVQLAAALEVHHARTLMSLSALTFVSADNSLNAAATAEGLVVDNPDTH